MNLRSSLGYPLMAFAFGLGTTSCGDSGTGTPVSTDTSTTSTQTTVTGTTTTTTATTDTTSGTTGPTGPTGGTGGTEPASTSGDSSGPSGSEDGTTAPPPVCEIPGFSVFSRSDTTAAWDDNDFSDVIIDAANCPPAIYVDTTWPHEAGWYNDDPSESNREQVHFTLDSGGGDLTNKQVTATVELADDVRGPNATAGGYLVSIVSVSTFDRITVVEPVEPVVPADAGLTDSASAPPAVDAGAADAAPPPPQTITETGYTEAESAVEDRVLLRHVGDRATITFTLPAKTAAVDSYDPARAIKVNLRFYTVFTPPAEPVVTEAVDAGFVDAAVIIPVTELADAGAGAFLDASVVEPELGPTPYDYLTSRFAITKFSITDVGAAPAP
jgi:hypothetical protein